MILGGIKVLIIKSILICMNSLNIRSKSLWGSLTDFSANESGQFWLIQDVKRFGDIS